MARTSAFAFRGKEVDVREIGARLNVEHILEGSVRRAGSRIRVTAQLVKASDGYHLWSQRFDREMTDVFAIQDEISQAIVEKLRVRLAGDRPLVKRTPRTSPPTTSVLRARYHLSEDDAGGTRGGQAVSGAGHRARPELRPGVRRDGRVLLAGAPSGDSRTRGRRSPGPSRRRSRPSASMTRWPRPTARWEPSWASASSIGRGAEREFRRALELSPSSAGVRYDYADSAVPSCRWGGWNEALTEIRRALELDPLDPFYNSLLGYLLHVDAAVRAGGRATAARHRPGPGLLLPHWLLAITYALTGAARRGDCRGREGQRAVRAQCADAGNPGQASTVGPAGRPRRGSCWRS